MCNWSTIIKIIKNDLILSMICNTCKLCLGDIDLVENVIRKELAVLTNRVNGECYKQAGYQLLLCVVYLLNRMVRL